MSFLNLFQPGSLRRHFSRSVFALCVLICLSAALLLTGCSTGDDPSLQEFITTIRIDTSDMTIEYEDSYKGKIVNSIPPDFSASSGVLIIRFTKYADFMNPPPVAEHEHVGRYGALYWTGLQNNTVKMADAFIEFNRAIFNTLTEAEAEFTMESVNDFINWGMVGEYTKDEADGFLNGVWVNVSFF